MKKSRIFMGEYSRNYLKASGASEEVAIAFDKMIKNIPQLSKNPAEAALQVKSTLYGRLGFCYNQNAFTIQDVLANRSGNCLGLPLLIGTIMGERGVEPSFRVLVNPKDFIQRHEEGFVKRFNSASNIELAERPSKQPIYRFVPLEHLIIDGNGGFFIEATSEEVHDAPASESSRSITFNQAISLVYKDRANQAGMNGNIESARKLAEKSVALWRDNREAHNLVASLAAVSFDDNTFEAAKKRYFEIGGKDSLYFFNRYVLGNRQKDLAKSLEKYPEFASAISEGARNLAKTSPNEARDRFVLASQCFANSSILSLADFYICNAKTLAKIFGVNKIDSILDNFVTERFGSFDYHLARYGVSGQFEHLAEAKEAIESPLHELLFVQASKGTALHKPDEVSRLDKKFASSKLYGEVKLPTAASCGASNED